MADSEGAAQSEQHQANQSKNVAAESVTTAPQPTRPVAGSRPPLASRTSKSKLIKQSAELDDDELQHHVVSGATPVHKMPIPETRIESADDLELEAHSTNNGSSINPNPQPTQSESCMIAAAVSTNAAMPVSNTMGSDQQQAVPMSDQSGVDANLVLEQQGQYQMQFVSQQSMDSGLGRRMAEMAVIGRRPLIRHNMGSSGSLGSSCDAISSSGGTTQQPNQPIPTLPPYLVLATTPSGGKVLMRSVALCGDDDTRLNPHRAFLGSQGTDNKQSSSKTGSCASSLSRGTSGESHASHEPYTDSTGVNLEEFICATLHKNKKDRETLLNLEREMRSFVQDASRQAHKFPPMSSYNRMLIHRTAAYFGLDHNVDQSGQAVVVNKTQNTRLPDVEFGSYIASDVFADDARRQLRRDYQSCEEVIQVADGTCLYALGPVSEASATAGNPLTGQRSYRKVRSFDERSATAAAAERRAAGSAAGTVPPAQPHLLQPNSAAATSSTASAQNPAPPVQLVPISVPYHLYQSGRSMSGHRMVYVPAASAAAWHHAQPGLGQGHGESSSMMESSATTSGDCGTTSCASGTDLQHVSSTTTTASQTASGGLLSVSISSGGQAPLTGVNPPVAMGRGAAAVTAVRPWSSAEVASHHGSAEGIQQPPGTAAQGTQFRAPTHPQNQAQTSQQHTLRASVPTLSQKANSFGGVPVIYRQAPVAQSDVPPSTGAAGYVRGYVGQPQRQNTDARSDMSSAPSVGSAGGDSNSPLHTQGAMGYGSGTPLAGVPPGGYYIPTAPYSHPIICAVASLEQVPADAVILHPRPMNVSQGGQITGQMTPQATGSGYASPIFMSPATMGAAASGYYTSCPTYYGQPYSSGSGGAGIPVGTNQGFGHAQSMEQLSATGRSAVNSSAGQHTDAGVQQQVFYPVQNAQGYYILGAAAPQPSQASQPQSNTSAIANPTVGIMPIETGGEQQQCVAGAGQQTVQVSENESGGKEAG